MVRETHEAPNIPESSVQEGRPKRRFSRRKFLGGAGVLAGAGALSALGINRFFQTEAKESLRPSDTFCCGDTEGQVSQGPEEPGLSEVEDIFKPKPLTETDKPPDLEFYFSDDISESDKNIIREAATRSHGFFHKGIGVYVKGTVRYSVENSESIGYTVTADGFSVRINTGHVGWKDTFDFDKRKIVVHESFHTLQEAMTRKQIGSIGIGGVGSWIIAEGGAEYAGFMAIVDAGLMPYEEVKRIAVRKARSRKLPHISSLNTRTEGAPYAMGFLAIDFLVGDKGLKIMGDYLRNVYEMPWQEAFEKTFGMTVEEFYDRFESFRKENNI